MDERVKKAFVRCRTVLNFEKSLYFAGPCTKDHWSELTIPASEVWGTISSMKKESSPKQPLALECPTCGAEPGEKCAPSTGQQRTEPHRDRRVIAKDLSLVRC
jgi:hypothetical protein